MICLEKLRVELNSVNINVNNMTFGKAKKSGSPKKAPKVPIPRKDKPFSQNKAMDDKIRRTSAQQPMKAKRLSK
jgi:hypothetical protein